MLFRIKERCGNHVQNNKIYKAGDVVETDKDLIATFGHKFERVHEDLHDTGLKDTSKVRVPNIPLPVEIKKEEEEEVVEEEVSEADESEEEESDEEESDGEASEYGKDVTDDFPTAGKVGVKVFEKSKWYMVLDTVDNAVLNDKKLRKKFVEPFLAQYNSEENSDSEED